MVVQERPSSQDCQAFLGASMFPASTATVTLARGRNAHAMVLAAVFLFRVGVDSCCPSSPWNHHGSGKHWNTICLVLGK